MSRPALTLAVSTRCPSELQPKPSGWSLSDFVLSKKLGVGGASAVYQGIYRKSGMCVALKVYYKSKMSVLNAHQVQREIMIHIQLNHPNIINLVCHLAFQGVLLISISSTTWNLSLATYASTTFTVSAA
jgi:serine/threonine protein kinase